MNTTFSILHLHLNVMYCLPSSSFITNFTVSFITAQDAFAEVPVNTAGGLGQNVTLNCALSDDAQSLTWSLQDGPTIFRKDEGIVPGLEEYYAVVGSYNLVALNASENQAGQYECECGTLFQSVLAEMILLGNLNQC